MSGPIPARANVEAGEQNRRPIGTGPFEFVSWLGGDRIVVKRFEDYWAKDEIHLDEVVFRILPDTQTRFASLKSGEVDVIWTDRGQTIVSAQRDPEIVSLQTQGAGAEIILLNARNAPLDDVRVRRALAHAFNQPAAVKIIWQDTKPVVSSPMGDSRDCGEAGLRGYDPKAAKALVEDYGQPIKLSMVHTATPRGRESLTHQGHSAPLRAGRRAAARARLGREEREVRAERGHVVAGVRLDEALERGHRAGHLGLGEEAEEADHREACQRGTRRAHQRSLEAQVASD